MEFIDLKSQQARIKETLDRRIAAVLAHGRYIMGPEVQELEERLAEYVGVKHCVSVSSGTDSLLIAMMALGIGPGDEVITVSYTWISTAEVVVLLGAKPVFIDIEEDTWNMDPTRIEPAITERTKAIMPVGIYGQTANMTSINEMAARYDLPVIEDAAQSFGATHCGKKSCGLSIIGSTSFFPSKPLGCYGDGGALFTDDDDLAQAMRQIRVHGQAKRHSHPILGINGRLDTIQAAVLLAKMNVFDDEIEMRNRVASTYNAELGSAVESIPRIAEGNTSVYAQYTIRSEDPGSLREELASAGIPSVSYYSVPLHCQPVFSNLGYRADDLPQTSRIASQALSLPSSPYLTDAQIDTVCSALNRLAAAAT